MTGYVGARRTLLIVDDQPIQRQMLAGLLLPLGFQLREAASGRECLESVRDDAPHAVLLDVSMDDMDGWETARRLRAAGHSALPVIMVSANAFENRPEILAEAGCQDFVDKPVVESALLEALQRHLGVQWVAEPAAPAWTPTTLTRPVRLPKEAVSTLVRLARLGHVQGVQAALDALSTDPGVDPSDLARLRALLDRFELDAFVDEVSRGRGATEAEAW